MVYAAQLAAALKAPSNVPVLRGMLRVPEPLPMAVYVPRRVRGRVLVLHGMNRRGIEEPRLHQLACALASVGLQAYVPRLPSVADLRFDVRSVDRVESVLNVLGPLGVIGVSFTGLVALKAAARVPEQVLSMALVGSTGRVRSVLCGLLDRDDADPYARAVVLENCLDLLGLPSPGLRAAFRAATSDECFETSTLPRVLKGLGPSDRALFTAMQKDPSLRRDVSMRLAGMRLPWDGLEFGGGWLDFPVALIHGERDTVIPPEESDHLHTVLPNSVLCRTPLLDHGTLQSAGPLAVMSLISTLSRFLDPLYGFGSPGVGSVSAQEPLAVNA